MCLLQNLNDSRFQSFALDYYIVNFIEGLYKVDEYRSVYISAEIWHFAWVNWGT